MYNILLLCLVLVVFKCEKAKTPEYCKSYFDKFTYDVANDKYIDGEGFFHYLVKLQGQQVAHIMSKGDPSSDKIIYYQNGGLDNVEMWKPSMNERSENGYFVFSADSKGFGCSVASTPAILGCENNPCVFPKDMDYTGEGLKEWHNMIIDHVIPCSDTSCKKFYDVSTVFGSKESGYTAESKSDRIKGMVRTGGSGNFRSIKYIPQGDFYKFPEKVRAVSYRMNSMFANMLFMSIFTSGKNPNVPLNMTFLGKIIELNLLKPWPLAGWIQRFALDNVVESYIKFRKETIPLMYDAKIPVLTIHSLTDRQQPIKGFDGSLTTDNDGNVIYNPDSGITEWTYFYKGVSEWNPLTGHFWHITNRDAQIDYIKKFTDAVETYGNEEWSLHYQPTFSYCAYDDYLFNVGTTFCTYTGKQCTCSGNMKLECVDSTCTQPPKIPVTLNPNPINPQLPPLTFEIKYPGLSIPKPMSDYIFDWQVQFGLFYQGFFGNFAQFEYMPFSNTCGMSTSDFEYGTVNDGFHQEFINHNC